MKNIYDCFIFKLTFYHYVSQVCSEFVKLVIQMSVSVGTVWSLNIFGRVHSINIMEFFVNVYYSGSYR